MATYENSDCSPWGGFHKCGYPKMLGVYFMENPHLEMDADRGTPTSESSISSIIPPPFFYMHARFVPSHIWLLYGYYMCIIWLLYGYYMVLIMVIIWL